MFHPECVRATEGWTQQRCFCDWRYSYFKVLPTLDLFTTKSSRPPKVSLLDPPRRVSPDSADSTRPACTRLLHVHDPETISAPSLTLFTRSEELDQSDSPIS